MEFKFWNNHESGPRRFFARNDGALEEIALNRAVGDLRVTFPHERAQNTGTEDQFEADVNAVLGRLGIRETVSEIERAAQADGTENFRADGEC